MNDTARQQLLAAKALIDSVLSDDAAVPSPAAGGAQPGAQEPGECPHPEEERVDASRMGHPSDWICRACSHTYCPEEGSDR